MESSGDLMSTPPMYRDIGSTFLAQQMTIPMGGVQPFVGGTTGVPPMRPSLTHDKFESIQQQKEDQKKQIKKTVGIIGGIAATALALVLFRKKLPAVDKLLTKISTGAKGFVKNTLPKAWEGVKGFFKGIVSKFKGMKALPPHVA